MNNFLILLILLLSFQSDVFAAAAGAEENPDYTHIQNFTPALCAWVNIQNPDKEALKEDPKKHRYNYLAALTRLWDKKPELVTKDHACLAGHLFMHLFLSGCDKAFDFQPIIRELVESKILDPEAINYPKTGYGCAIAEADGNIAYIKQGNLPRFISGFPHEQTEILFGGGAPELCCGEPKRHGRFFTVDCCASRGPHMLGDIEDPTLYKFFQHVHTAWFEHVALESLLLAQSENPLLFQNIANMIIPYGVLCFQDSCFREKDYAEAKRRYLQKALSILGKTYGFALLNAQTMPVLMSYSAQEHAVVGYAPTFIFVRTNDAEGGLRGPQFDRLATKRAQAMLNRVMIPRGLPVSDVPPSAGSRK